jgi:hypothetical protein
MEQRMNNKICFKKGKTTTEPFQPIKQVYGVNAVSRTQVFEWYAKFQNVCDNLGK